MDLPVKLPEHRVNSSLFNVVNESQRQMDPPSIEHRCLAYWYTKSVYLLDLIQCINIYRRQMVVTDI